MPDSCPAVEVTNGPAVVISPDEASDIVAGQSLTCATRATASSATAATAKRIPTIAPIRDSCATTYEEVPLESPTDSSASSSFSSLFTSPSPSVTTSAETTDTDTAPPSPLLDAAEAIDGDPAAADLAATTNTCTTPGSSSSVALAFALRNLAQHQLRYSGGSGHTSPTRGYQPATSKSKSPLRSRPTFRRIPIKIAMSEKEAEETNNGESTPVEESVVSDKESPEATPRPKSVAKDAASDDAVESSPAETTDGASEPAQAAVDTKETKAEADAEPEKPAAEDKESKAKAKAPAKSVTDTKDSKAKAEETAKAESNPTGPEVEGTTVAPETTATQPGAEEPAVFAPVPIAEDEPSPKRVIKGLSGDFSVNQPPPPSTADRAQALEQGLPAERVVSPPPTANLARKASSGFGALLGRIGRKSAPSPPGSQLGERRNTATSVTSTEAASITGLRSIADESEGRPSLQDQFSNLRREQEYHMENVNLTEEGDDSAVMTKPAGDSRPTSPPSPASTLKSASMDPSLPPGTAAGMSAGPAELPREVNWDLWQQVVYEGPAAVARTSGAELNQAIASGIPPAIRGVVWQVLAESKNEELEHVYHTLKARGTDAERPTPSRAGSTTTNGTTHVNGAAPESIVSDNSSTHSDNSTPAASGLASPPVSIEGQSAELQSKLLLEKQKREAAALTKLEKAIRRDLGSRTSYSKYTQSAGLQDGLFGVCKAYALFDEGVGYAQGINFIAMPLLFNMSEEEAFTLLVRLMSKYNLRSLFTADMPGLHLRLYQFERLLEDFEPAVYCHLRRRNVTPQLYATQWFLTLFAYRFPLQLVLRVYDLLLTEGTTAILKFGIVLMQRNREALLAMRDMSQLTTFLKEKIFDVYIDKSPSASSLLDSGFFGSVTGGADRELYRADELVADACEITLPEATLAGYTAEWEEQQRTTREREQELEQLRSSNASLTARVKSLEERVQQHDTEHVSMAQELVRVKVENDSLQDANEGLRLRAEELQRLLDAAPAEIETRLKDEMERIMQRNIEVQNENRHLKDEMDEMEHALVNVKMLHAQSQTDHDSLKQKWNSMQALLNDKS